MTSETVATAALETLTGKVITLPRPARHGDVILFMRKEGYTRSDVAHATQGFVTSKGRFVDRIEGADLVIKSGTPILFRGSTGEVTGTRGRLNWPPNLYSEDLW